MKLSEVVRALDAVCPAAFAAEWDLVGLQVGDGEREVGHILVALDADRDTIARGAAGGFDLLVTHHPMFVDPPRRFTNHDAVGQQVAEAIRAGLAVYCAHTNFDSVRGGVNDVLAERLGLADVAVLAACGSLRKVVAFVPQEHVEGVFLAMANAGAGQIGAYGECSFRVAGQGTFTAPPDAHPALGKAGRANKVDEIRLETTVPEEAVAGVVAAMTAAHPYEEAAYDVYSLQNPRGDVGLGRIGRIEPTRLDEFAADCAAKLEVTTVKYAGSKEKIVEVVAVCGGSGGSLIGSAASRGADILVSGDLRYHDSQRAIAAGLALVDAGHQGTEAPALGALADLVRGALSEVGYTGRVDVYKAAELWRPAGG